MRESRKKMARDHRERMSKVFSKEIQKSIDSAIVYEDGREQGSVVVRGLDTKFKFVSESTVEAVMRCQERSIAALDFASFKNPGGGFLSGAKSQEEDLCHSSTLFNILSSEKIDKVFYDRNKKNLNRGLYDSTVLYVPSVIFCDEKKCDVIVSAAPNAKAFKCGSISDNEKLDKALKDRIDSVLYSACKNEVNSLVLGAFGCGVFGNNPIAVGSWFGRWLKGKYAGCFNQVIFAIPGSNMAPFRKGFESA